MAPQKFCIGGAKISNPRMAVLRDLIDRLQEGQTLRHIVVYDTYSIRLYYVTDLYKELVSREGTSCRILVHSFGDFVSQLTCRYCT